MIFLAAVSHRSTSPLNVPTARVAVPGLNAADSTAWLPTGAARMADGLASAYERAVLRDTLQRHRVELQAGR